MKAILTTELGTVPGKSSHTEVATVIVIPEIDACVRLYSGNEIQLTGIRPGWILENPDKPQIELPTLLAETIRDARVLQQNLYLKQTRLSILCEVELRPILASIPVTA